MMRFLNNILTIGKPTHTCKLWYHVLNTCLPHLRIVMDTTDAEHVLSKHYADTGSSCLKENTIIEPETDLRIIVPAYNAEKWIEECISSIANQETQYKYEVFIINDGSTDRTPEILQSFANHKNITIINKENKGVSAARNEALKKISARYVMFVDADDILPQDAIENLLNNAYEHNSDIVEGNIETTNGEPVITYEISGPTKDLSGYACAKLFNSTLFTNCGFPEGYRYEDTLMSFVLFPKAKTMSCEAVCVYKYRQHSNSFTSHETNNYSTLDAYWVVKQLLTDIDTIGCENIQQLYEAFLQGIKLSGGRMGTLDKETDKSYFAAMSNIANTRFADYTTNIKTLQKIDKALKSHDFTLYKLASTLL